MPSAVRRGMRSHTERHADRCSIVVVDGVAVLRKYGPFIAIAFMVIVTVFWMCIRFRGRHIRFDDSAKRAVAWEQQFGLDMERLWTNYRRKRFLTPLCARRAGVKCS